MKREQSHFDRLLRLLHITLNFPFLIFKLVLFWNLWIKCKWSDVVEEHFQITLVCKSSCKASRVSPASLLAAWSAWAFLARASRSLVATSNSACLVLICAVHGWSSFCLAWIWSWKTCVLSVAKFTTGSIYEEIIKPFKLSWMPSRTFSSSPSETSYSSCLVFSLLILAVLSSMVWRAVFLAAPSY